MKMDFSYNELYPGMSATPTLDTDTTPDAEEQKALVQDPQVADMTLVSGAKKTSIFAALAVLIVLAFIMGIAK